ncbi:MAG TPA: pitrilysin family protein [Acidobacteriota bacterium]|nr:pitrilysin family protein [Acidobacteriota bacterium]
MAIKRIMVFVGIISISAVMVWAADNPPAPELFTKRLLNGLQITVATPPDSGDDMAIGLVVRYGSAFDPEGKDGVAHFLSRMFMKNAAGKNLKDIERELSYIGADVEIRFDWDGFRFMLKGNSATYERSLLLLYQIIAEARFEEDHIAEVRRAILNDLQKPADPRDYIRERFEEVLFGGTTYGRSIYGTAGTVSSITIGDIRHFYRRFFSPHQASLQIVGNLPVDEVLKRATRIWGVWVQNDDVPFSFLQPQNPADLQVFIEDVPGSPAANLIMGWLFPRREDPGFLNAVMAGRILQERLTALMPTALVTVGLEGRRLASPFFIEAQASADQAVAHIQEIRKAVGEMKSSPVSEEELAAVKQKLIDEFFSALKTSAGICSVLLDAELYRLGSNYPAVFLNRVRLADVEAVRLAANTWFLKDAGLIIMRGPYSVLRPDLGILGPFRRMVPR